MRRLLLAALMLRVWWDPCMMGCDKINGIVIGSYGNIGLGHPVGLIVRLDSGKMETCMLNEIEHSEWVEVP